MHVQQKSYSGLLLATVCLHLFKTFKCGKCEEKNSAQNSDLKTHIVRAYLQNKQWLRIDRALPHTVLL